MTQDARFTVLPGQTVTAFALGPLHQTYFPGLPRALPDTVTYRFVNGFTDVGTLPCRIAVLEQIATRRVDFAPDPTDTAINLPGFNRRLEFSGFWHRPTRLARWARTRLIPHRAGVHRFRLETCGGAHLWVDGAGVAAFEPYTRNSPSATEITLTLPPQGAELVLLMEDIAERDTNFFVELTLLGDHPVEAAVPSRARPADLAALMALARDIRPGQVVFSGGDLTLRVDDPPESDVQITAQVGQSVHLSHLPPLFTGRGTLRAGATEVSLGPLAPLAEAYHPLKLTLSIGDARVERSIAFALLRQTRPQDLPGDLAARKAAALEFAARNGEAQIGRVLARFAAGLGWDARSLQCLIRSAF